MTTRCSATRAGRMHLGRLGYFHLTCDPFIASLLLGPFSSNDIGTDTDSSGATITTSTSC